MKVPVEIFSRFKFKIYVVTPTASQRFSIWFRLIIFFPSGPFAILNTLYTVCNDSLLAVT